MNGRLNFKITVNMPREKSNDQYNFKNFKNLRKVPGLVLFLTTK